MKSTVPLKIQFHRFINDHELIIFTLTVLVLCLLTYWVAVALPVLIVAILLAYLLDNIVTRLHSMGCPYQFAVTSTLLMCLLSLILLLLLGVPKLTAQLSNFAVQLPTIIPKFQLWLDNKLSALPFEEHFDSTVMLQPVIDWLSSLSENIVSTTFTNVFGIFTLMVYAVMLPLLLYFLLTDKQRIFAWTRKFVPESQMFNDLKEALHEQFGAYVRGKIIEGMIIFALSFISFSLLGVKYAFALSVAIGLSVIIPFVGAIAVTIPVVLAGLIQFGGASELWWLLGIYAVIQALDGQILVPLLFSEIVKIHPVAILVAILFFGSIWGIWGVFFAIPLASLIKSVISVVNRQLSVKQV